MSPRKAIPTERAETKDVIAQLEAIKSHDVDWRGGRVFSLVYHGGEAHEELLKQAHGVFASANLLNPMAFQGLRRLEAEIVQMFAGLVHGPDSAVGCVTSGGTESILVAMHGYRERARKERPWIRSPEVLAPRTIHPAFVKAAHYFGFKLRKVDVDDGFRADIRQMARKINRNTIGLVVSAPQYPQGVIDPVEQASELALKHGLPLHVDACVGGWMLPWIEKLGRPLPPWDFRLGGVTSMSADIHKYGYGAKGASLLLWRSMDSMKHQFFVDTEFPGGVYVSPTMIGTRPGGPIAAAWAALVGEGEAGYLELTRKALEAADKLRAGIAGINGLTLLGHADRRGETTIVCWSTDPGQKLDVYTIADRLEHRGWQVDRQHKPSCIHLTVTANHLAVVDHYLADLRESVAEVRNNPSLVASGTAATYGMMAKVPIRALVGQTVRKAFEQMYSPGVIVPDLSAPQGEGFIDQFVAKYGPQINQVLDKVEAFREKFTR